MIKRSLMKFWKFTTLNDSLQIKRSLPRLSGRDQPDTSSLKFWDFCRNKDEEEEEEEEEESAWPSGY